MYTLNLHNVICQLYLNNAGEKMKKILAPDSELYRK